MPTRKAPAPKAAKAAPAEETKPASPKAPARKAAPKATSKAAPGAALPESPAPETAVEAKPAKAPKAAKGGKAKAAKADAASEATAPTADLDPHAQAILAAIREGRALEFIFADGETNPPRTFEPRMLSFEALSRSWYVWGWDRRYNAERHHRLDLLKEVNAVEGVGRSAQGPYKEGTPANQIGGWLGGEPIPVKATLLKQWIFAVKQAPPPFPEFRLEELEEGKASVSFTATDLRAIARWCMQFGDGIQVQEPQRLVDRIKQVGVAWGGKAAQAPPPPPPPRPQPPTPQAPPPRHREAEEKPKAAGKGPKVEVRIERL